MVEASSANIFLGYIVATATEMDFVASVWTSQSRVHSITSVHLPCWLPRLPSPFTSMKFLPVVTSLHPGRPSVSKSASAHLRLPPTPFTWRPNSPWCPGPAARAAAWRAKLYKDAQSWQIWSSSAWLSRRDGCLEGKVVALPPPVGGGSGKVAHKE